MTILAIDPGPTESAFVAWHVPTGDPPRIMNSGKVTNYQLISYLDRMTDEIHWRLVVERFQSHAMPIGEECLETVRWEGRFLQVWGKDAVSMPRMKVKQHLCHDSRAKDSNIRQALIDRFGKPGTKKAPGLLYGVSGDVWAALALAVTYVDQFAEEAPRNA
jgi:hypothetical protein